MCARLFNGIFRRKPAARFGSTMPRKMPVDPREKVQSYADLLAHFDHFQDEWLRDEQNERFVPKAFVGQPYYVFETGGTTGMPKQRISWNDHNIDYEEFSNTLGR